jgi:TP901 family phage tail tape measure protein
MANALQYILSLDDRMSGKLKALGISSDSALNKFAGLQRQSIQVGANLNAMGRSVSTLSDKLNLMRAERDLIPAKNIRDIRLYNTEIQKLEKEIGKLQTVNNGSRLKSLTKDAMSSLPGASFITNPVVAVTAAVGFMTKQALNFDEGMAKINTTAQLSADKLAILKSQILKVGKDMKVDPAQLTPTFEKILSQVGDVDVSMKIFEQTLKGSKAGFTDAAIVADALAQSVSAIGSKNASAQQVLDVLFAAKRVGAGEFADYAHYVPGLIADARNLGIAFQDTAGIFAYMTAKGNTAERSAMLMQNAFTALSKGEIQKGLADAGVNVFDKAGNIRAIEDIMGELSVKLQSLGSDAARSNFLEKIGLKDAQAKSAFSVLTSEVDKLKTTLNATRNATGETDQALKLSMSSAQSLSDLWNVMKTSLTEAGGGFVELLKPVMQLGGYVMDVLGPVLGWVGKSLSWVTKQLQDGNPLVWGFAVAIGALTVASNAAAWKLQVLTTWTKIHTWAVKEGGLFTKIWAGAQSIATIATGAWTAAQWLLNAAFIASPIGWIVLGIGALTVGIIWAWKHFEGFRKFLYGLWESFKQVFTNIGNFFKKIFEPIGEAIQAFKEGRFGDAAKAVGKMVFNLTPIGMITQAVKFTAEGGLTKGVSEAYQKGAAKGGKTDEAGTNQKAHPFVMAPVIQQGQEAQPVNPGINIINPGNADKANPWPQANLTPGAQETKTTTATYNPDTETKETRKSEEAIATGGQKTQNFTINIKSMIENFSLNNANGDPVEKVTDEMLDGMLRLFTTMQSLSNG